MAKNKNKSIENLIPFTAMSEEKQKEMASKAGKASAEAKKRKKTLREELEIMLDIKNKDGKTNQEAISVALMQQAKRGNIKAYEVIRDTVGEKPIDEKKVTAEVTAINIEDYISKVEGNEY